MSKNVFAESAVSQSEASQNPFGTVDAAHAYGAFLKRIYGHFQNGHIRVQWHWAKQAQTKQEFKCDVQDALNKRIWLKGNPALHWRKIQPLYETELKRDVANLENIQFRRIRVYQFVTPEMRKRFGHLLSSRSEE